MKQDDYGQAWIDHAKWLRRQGNSRRAGAERDALYAQAQQAREIGLKAQGYVLFAQLLPFDTPYGMGVSLSDTDDSPWPRDGGWVCRYCGRGEGTPTGVRVRLTIAAEHGRCVTHEAMCPDRPAATPVTDDEKRTMAVYLRNWLKPRLEAVDGQLAFLSPQPGYRQTPDRAAESARWQVIRAEYLAVLTRCGVDDESMAALPPARRQTREEFLAEIRALAAGARRAQ